MLAHEVERALPLFRPGLEYVLDLELDARRWRLREAVLDIGADERRGLFVGESGLDLGELVACTGSDLLSI